VFDGDAKAMGERSPINLRDRLLAGEIPYIEPGQTLETTVTLQPGTYTIYCSLPGRRDAGMIATLRLK
jgi:uncharacterized cupredoxin-like copper-binding protein